MKKIISVVLIVCILCSSFSSCAFIGPSYGSKVTVGEWLEMLCTTFGMVEPVNSNFENNFEAARNWNIISSDFTGKEDEEIVAAFASETLLNVFDYDEKEQEKINDILGFTSRRKGLDKVNVKTAKAAIEYAHSCWANYAPESRSNYEVSEKTLEIGVNAINEANESKGTVSISSTYSNQDYIFLDEEIWENSGRVFAIDKNASYDGNIVAKQISEEIELEEVFDKVDTAGTVRAKVSDIFAYDANGNKIPVEYDTGISNLSATEIPSVISLSTKGRAVSSEGKRFQIPLGTKMKLIGEIEGSKIDFAVEYDGKSSKDIGMSAFAAVDFGDVSFEYVSEEKHVYLKTDFDIRYGFSANGAKMVLPENVSKDILSGSKNIKEAIKELEDIYKSPFSDMLDEFNASPSVDKEKYSIALIEVPLYTDGVNSVTVKLSIFLKMDGTLGIETVMDENVIGVEYRKGAGIRPIFDLSEPKTEIELDLSARVGLGVGLFYKVINYPIVDCTFDFGVDAECSGKIIDLSGTYFCGAVSLPKHAFEELSEYGYFTEDGTIHSCVDINCGIFLDFSVGENSLLGKVKSTSWTLINPRKATIYSTHADDRKTVEKCIFEDIGGVENYEPTKVDFAKLDEWIGNRLKERYALPILSIINIDNEWIYYIDFEPYVEDDYGYKVCRYNIFSGIKEEIFDPKNFFEYDDMDIVHLKYYAEDNKIYIARGPKDQGKVLLNSYTDFCKLYIYDIKNRRLELINDELRLGPWDICTVEDSIIIFGNDFWINEEMDTSQNPYPYNIIVDNNGAATKGLKNIDFDDVWGRTFLGKVGDETYYSAYKGSLNKIYSTGEEVMVCELNEPVEIVGSDDSCLYITNDTYGFLQDYPYMPVLNYIKCYNTQEGSLSNINIDVNYNNYKMVSVICVLDNNIYVAYTDADLNNDKMIEDFEWSGGWQRFIIEYGYNIYLYRYNMETGEYTLVAQ
ncbi:MAG: hypothetical protein IJA17_01920 [Oscillospiraceae bacterium]|nr:hypothetical protein [Oscillospiraceae bacterium]